MQAREMLQSRQTHLRIAAERKDRYLPRSLSRLTASRRRLLFPESTGFRRGHRRTNLRSVPGLPLNDGSVSAPILNEERLCHMPTGNEAESGASAMRAVILSSDGVAFKEDYPQPIPSEDEVTVRVLRAGICETDLQLTQGYMGFRGVLGHEFVGVAESGRLKGERVVGEINCSCQHCDLCRSGLSNHCPNRSVLGILSRDGAFADLLCLPERNLHRVPDDVSTDEAVFTEPLAAAFQICEQIRLSSSSRIVVLGDGRLGNLCAQVCLLQGCHVTVVGKHQQKLALLERRGIETVLLAERAPDRQADVVIDCTGAENGLPTALGFVKPRGTIVMKTTIAGEQAVSLAPIVIDEVTVVGSRCGPFPAALAALERQEVDVLPLVSARFPLEETVTALEQASRSSDLKVLLDL